jgi:hypothetical protein
MRRAILAVVLLPAAGGAAAGVALTGGAPGWSVLLGAVVIGSAWAWYLVGRNWRSWAYTERQDDLLVVHGAMFRKLVVVPYGRMQLVDVEAGPVERLFDLVTVKLHTAAATTDARVCGLGPSDATALRDRLTALGEAHAAGL